MSDYLKHLKVGKVIWEVKQQVLHLCVLSSFEFSDEYLKQRQLLV
jgi:hypothetical protein